MSSISLRSFVYTKFFAEVWCLGHQEGLRVLLLRLKRFPQIAQIAPIAEAERAILGAQREAGSHIAGIPRKNRLRAALLRLSA
jgi:hypothetical protein